MTNRTHSSARNRSIVPPQDVAPLSRPSETTMKVARPETPAERTARLRSELEQAEKEEARIAAEAAEKEQRRQAAAAEARRQAEEAARAAKPTNVVDLAILVEATKRSLLAEGFGPIRARRVVSQPGTETILAERDYAKTEDRRADILALAELQPVFRIRDVEEHLGLSARMARYHVDKMIGTRDIFEMTETSAEVPGKGLRSIYSRDPQVLVEVITGKRDRAGKPVGRA